MTDDLFCWLMDAKDEGNKEEREELEVSSTRLFSFPLLSSPPLKPEATYSVV